MKRKLTEIVELLTAVVKLISWAILLAWLLEVIETVGPRLAELAQ